MQLSAPLCDFVSLRLLASHLQLWWNTVKVLTNTKRDSNHITPGLIIVTWLWIVSILFLSFASLVTIVPMWSSQLNFSSWSPRKWYLGIWFSCAVITWVRYPGFSCHEVQCPILTTVVPGFSNDAIGWSSRSKWGPFGDLYFARKKTFKKKMYYVVSGWYR